ncbi:MAG: quercetin 2,3-dioxygenase [Bryobacteraceae bacterium]|nr:MAG: quercetin 2,3-dioxygenase [Bryobacteraceae bacterium]
MIRLRPSAERGVTQVDWLDSRHTFSFNRYIDPAWTSFQSLRVINEDWIAPGGRFDWHPHRDMEILTWILSGALEHEDSTGARGVLRPGDLQKMSAGTGIFHSEANASKTEPLHLLQIWIYPSQRGLQPHYVEKHFPLEDRRNRLCLLASPGGRDGSLPIHQAAELWTAVLDEGASVEHALAAGRHAWLQVASGEVDLNGTALHAGDGAAVSEEPVLRISARRASEVLVFDLA